ncbi:hypothetical protein CK203_078874 [Vitis vinifera]|uniref:Uncharacterized protein n=1 Tax=Vitis vinifera TaxID=29760 RepID=A0A438FBY7_VITVI|nr:hypothetical protein CK203_078874 [Vitis vinifera]
MEFLATRSDHHLIDSAWNEVEDDLMLSHTGKSHSWSMAFSSSSLGISDCSQVEGSFGNSRVVEEEDCGKDRERAVFSEEGSGSSLTVFSKWLGMLTKGFEEETLALLRKIKVRKGCKVQENVERRKKAFPSKFERGLRRLECSVNYNGAGRRGSVNGKGVSELVSVGQ